MSPEQKGDKSFRTNPLRRVQDALQGSTPELINRMYHRGMLKGTIAAEVLDKGEALHADHLTLAGLQLTIRSSRLLVTYGDYASMIGTFVGGLLDGLDGMLARYLNESSPEGAVKDVAADRVTESVMAKLIGDSRGKYKDSPPELEKQLIIAFTLSTLTKAESQMAGVHTTEGGQGSMFERRRKLAFILKDLGDLNVRTHLSDASRRRRVLKVDKRIKSLIDGSQERAIGRIEKIKAATAARKLGWENPALQDPKSPAATEARKYAIVVRMMKEKMGLDMVGYLNGLTDKEVFPTWETLAQRYDYIGGAMEATEEFVNQAFTLTARE